MSIKKGRETAIENNQATLEKVRQFVEWVKTAPGVEVLGAIASPSAEGNGYLIVRGEIPESVVDGLVGRLQLRPTAGGGGRAVFRGSSSQGPIDSESLWLTMLIVGSLTANPLPVELTQDWIHLEDIRQLLAQFLVEKDSEQFRALQEIIQRREAGMAEAAREAVRTMFGEFDPQIRGEPNTTYH